MRFAPALWCLTFLASGLASDKVCAEAYDTALKGVAANLVLKLEDAKQHSGTVLDFTDLQGAPTELGRFLAQELSGYLVGAGK